MENDTENAELTEDLVLRVWDGDDSVLGDLLMMFAANLETSIGKRFQLNDADVEDVVSEAFGQFWAARENYDSTRPFGAYLYQIAFRIALKLVTGHLRWQHTRRLERSVDPEYFNEIADPGQDVDQRENEAPYDSKISKATRKALGTLSGLERAVIVAYGLAGDTKIDAAQLGLELGTSHGDGTAIPAGTIRVTKHRAKTKLATAMRNLGFPITQTGATK